MFEIPAHLQQTLTTLLAAAHIEAEKFDEDGVAYSTIHIPSSTPPLELDYAFVDGHLILGSSRETVADAVRLHKTGESLAKSKTFLASLPPGHPLEASAMVYQDPAAIAALQLRAIAPDMARSLAQNAKQILPAVVSVYGEESTIRESSNNGAYDFGAVMVLAAIAIPQPAAFENGCQRSECGRQRAHREHRRGYLREYVSPERLCARFGHARHRSP